MFRNPKHLGRWIAIAVAIGLLCASDGRAGKPEKLPSGPAYSIVPFSTPDIPLNFESGGSLVLGLNDVGNAVGVEDFGEELPNGSFQTVRWALHLEMATWTYTQLQDCEIPMGVNNLNQIVGHRPSGALAFWKAPGAAPVDLPLLPGDTGVGSWRSTTRGSLWGTRTPTTFRQERVSSGAPWWTKPATYP